MANNILLYDLDSSDSDDEDFVPAAHSDDSCDEGDSVGANSDVDTPKTESKAKGKGRNKKQVRNPKKKKVENDEEVSTNGAASEAKETLKNGESAKEDMEKRADELFKAFLDDIENEKKQTSGSSASKSTTSDSTSSSSSTPKVKKTVTEFFDYAGEIVPVEKEILVDDVSPHPSSCTSTAKNGHAEEEAKPKAFPGNFKRKGGLESVIRFIDNKKRKMTTLTKTQLDWRKFKKQHGIEEELASHNKGRQGFLQKKAFLEESDLRSFEVEKNLRLSKKKK